MPAEQRTALVTGGSGGLGEAIARALHDAGHTVLIVHSPGNASIGAWLKTQAGEGYDFAAYGADVADHASCQELAVDHGFTVPMQLFWPGAPHHPDMPRAIPISANTVQHPIPTLRRALNFGRSLRKAVESYPEDLKVVVLGTGGLSHQLDGQRAGFINKEFDQYCLENIVHNPEELTRITRMELVEKAGAQGTEFLMWMMMRGALGDKVTKVTENYHIPISNTGAGTMVLESAA